MNETQPESVFLAKLDNDCCKQHTPGKQNFCIITFLFNLNIKYFFCKFLDDGFKEFKDSKISRKSFEKIICDLGKVFISWQFQYFLYWEIFCDMLTNTNTPLSLKVT